MGRIDKPEYKKKESIYPVYTAKDFFALEAELEKFAVDKELPFFDSDKREIKHFVSTEGIQQWLIEKGALSNKKEWCVKNILLFKELEDKLQQYSFWCRKREYAIKHQNEDYDHLADQIEIVDDTPF